MIITGASVFCEDGTFVTKEVFVENHRIVSSGQEVTDRTVVDGRGCKLIPGLVDVHSHGACGHDFCDGDAGELREILRYERAHGITSYCPTSMTLPTERLISIFATARDAEEEVDLAHIVGVNMEGPFLSEAKKGAQNGAYLAAPSAKLFHVCQEASGGRIRLVTLAPETDGAVDFLDAVHNEVHVSLGHTTADYATAREAFAHGADHVTHLFNCMPPLGHREPGVIGAALDDGAAYVELICDGVHIHAAAVRAAFRIFGAERMVLISDSMRAAGMPNGTYELGGQSVSVKDGRATLADGTIAGSAVCLYDCLRTALSFGIPEADALFAATRNPAKSIGVYDRVGSITAGKEADLLLVDPNYRLLQVL